MSSRFKRLARAAMATVPAIPGGALVLMYHRAATLDEDPWRLAVRPERLAEHLAILARYTRPMTAGSLAEAVDGRLPRSTVVVTFDDGYADLATEVRPLLDRTGVPATMFMVSGAIDGQREFWWDALEHVFLGDHPLPSELLLALPGGDLRLTFSAGPTETLRPDQPRMRWRAWQPPPTSRHAAYRETWERLRVLTPDHREAWVDELCARAGVDRAPRQTHRTLTTEELVAVGSDPLVEIGSHTVNHPSLAALTTEDRRREILDGKAALERWLGRPVSTFAYPYGGTEDVDAATVAEARRVGFAAAFTSVAGRVRTGAVRHAFPRVFVEDLDGDAFARLLWHQAGIRVA